MVAGHADHRVELARWAGAGSRGRARACTWLLSPRRGWCRLAAAPRRATCSAPSGALAQRCCSPPRPTTAASSGWHTHATDYAVESLEPSCLFRVQRDGRSIALASLAADGHLLCATGNGDRLGLAACGGSGWAAAGAAWEQRNGAICNARWPDKVRARVPATARWHGAGGTRPAMVGGLVLGAATPAAARRTP